jgi:hypothetical protein
MEEALNKQEDKMTWPSHHPVLLSASPVLTWWAHEWNGHVTSNKAWVEIIWAPIHLS